MLGAPTKVTDPTGTVSSTSYNQTNGRVTETAILEDTEEQAKLQYSYANGRISAQTRTAQLPNVTPFTLVYGMWDRGRFLAPPDPTQLNP